MFIDSTPWIRSIAGLLLFSLLTGCSAYPFGFARKKRQECFYPMHGVDDHMFHGHRKTCWRSWDDPAWTAVPCPEFHAPPAPSGPIFAPEPTIPPAVSPLSGTAIPHHSELQPGGYLHLSESSPSMQPMFPSAGSRYNSLLQPPPIPFADDVQ